MRKVLITGAGGFIGSHLTETCVKRGDRVKAFIHYNSANSRGWLENSPYAKDIDFISGDVRDYDVILSAMKGCEHVYHLAALIGIPYSYISPVAYIKTNVEGTYNILQASKQLKVKNVVVTSTSETYGTAQYVPIDEKHPINSQSPYAASKAAADQLAMSFYSSYGIKVKIARPFNTFGPRQSARAIIPTIIAQILSGKKKIKLGNLSPTRDFTYVKDTASGILAIAKSTKTVGHATNIGTNNEISVGELARTIARLMDAKIEIISENQRVRPKTSEVERLVCSNKKIRKDSTWSPQYKLKEGLLETIDFIRKNQSLYKANIYNV